jgi:hypothetical protein
MKHLFIFCTALLCLQSCGPAAEDRELMHIKAKKFQDSIANLIRLQMSEADPSASSIPRPDNPATQRGKTGTEETPE